MSQKFRKEYFQSISTSSSLILPSFMSRSFRGKMYFLYYTANRHKYHLLSARFYVTKNKKNKIHNFCSSHSKSTFFNDMIWCSAEGRAPTYMRVPSLILPSFMSQKITKSKFVVFVPLHHFHFFAQIYVTKNRKNKSILLFIHHSLPFCLVLCHKKLNS